MEQKNRNKTNTEADRETWTHMKKGRMQKERKKKQEKKDKKSKGRNWEKQVYQAVGG
jgi:hypothetical protein